MAPSPLCGNLVTFVKFISKTRIKITFPWNWRSRHESQLPWVCRRQGKGVPCSLTALRNRSPYKTGFNGFILLRWVALLMLLCLQGYPLESVLQRHFKSKARSKICLSLTALLYCRTSSSSWTFLGICFGTCSRCSEEWEEQCQGVAVESAQIEPIHTCASGVTEGFSFSTWYVCSHAYGTKEGGIFSFIELLSGSTW